MLVVEDEPVIRDLLVEGLQDLGFRALQAPDGPSGLRILQSGKRLDLFVTAMVWLDAHNSRSPAWASK